MRDFFRRPTMRFLAGFGFACFLFIPVMWVVLGPPGSFSFLLPMAAVGIVCGILWVRRPPRFFTHVGSAS